MSYRAFRVVGGLNCNVSVDDNSQCRAGVCWLVAWYNLKAKTAFAWQPEPTRQIATANEYVHPHLEMRDQRNHWPAVTELTM